MSWFSGYGGQPTLSESARDKSYLSGIGLTHDSVTGITGTTAQDAYDRYAATGATSNELAAFAHRIAASHGRS